MRSVREVTDIPLHKILNEIQPLKLNETEEFLKQSFSKLNQFQRQLQKVN